MSKVVLSTTAGSVWSPAKTSRYALATRRGVSTSPSRSGSSPIAMRISRTAASMRGMSKLPWPTGLRRPRPSPSMSVLLERSVVGAARGPGGRRPPTGRRGVVPRLAGRRVAGGQLGSTSRYGFQLGLGPYGRVHRREIGGETRLGAGPCGTLLVPLQRHEDRRDLLLVERLLLQQLADQLVEHMTVLHQHVERLLMGGGDEQRDLLVDDRRDALRVGALLGHHLHTHERFAVVGAELYGTQPLRHAVLRDHRPRDLGRLLD